MRLILTAHGSADPRFSAVTEAVADEIRRQRRGLDVDVAFCEHNTPNLREVLAGLDGPAVVTPLLLASAYHARVDIPAIVAQASTSQPRNLRPEVWQADALGEDPRLVQVMYERLVELGLEPADTGVLVVAVGSSHAEANARTATVASALTRRGDPAAVRVAHATRRHSVQHGIAALRRTGVNRIVLAPWFIAPGRIIDQVADVAAAHGVSMAEPLGAHPLVAQTVLDRFDDAVTQRLAA